MSFYFKFLELCNSVGKSPSKVALEIGTTKPAVTRWKQGSNPSDAVLLKIADYFGVSVEYLKGETEQKEKLPLEIEKKLLEMYELTKGLDEIDRIALKAYADGLRAKREQG